MGPAGTNESTGWRKANENSVLRQVLPCLGVQGGSTGDEGHCEGEGFSDFVMQTSSDGLSNSPEGT